MELKLDVSYGQADELFLNLLCNGYENTYFCYSEDLNMFAKDPIRNNYKKEDIQYNEKVLEAFEILAEHYSAHGEGQKMLDRIRDRFDAHWLIAKGMSNG